MSFLGIMGKERAIEVATSMIAFSTFLGVLFAGLYYFYQIKEVNFIEAILFVVIYININLLFILYIKKGFE